MPKRRDTGSPRPDDRLEPPEQAEVERAIETIVERLKPKRPKSGTPPRKPGRGARPPGRLGLA